MDSDEDEEVDQSEESETEERPQPKRGGRKTKPMLFDSDEESDLELFEMDKSLRSKICLVLKACTLLFQQMYCNMVVTSYIW